MLTRTPKTLLFFIALFFAGYYANAQALLWQQNLATSDSLSAGIIVKHDAHNNVFTVGGMPRGIYISKQDSNGSLQWHTVFNRPSGSPALMRTTGMQVDDSGNTYVCGIIDFWPTFDTGFVMKIDGAGSISWVHYETGSIGEVGVGQVYGMALTPDGNIVTLVSRVDSDYTVKAVIKSITRASGMVNWSQVQGLVDSTDMPDAELANFIGADDTGNIYVSLRNLNFTTAYRKTVVFAKYASDGTLKWETETATPIGEFINLQDVVVDGKGNIYGAGWFSAPGSFMRDIAIKCSSSGAVEYIEHFAYPDSGQFSLSDIKVDSLGEVYLFGSVSHFLVPGQCAMAKLGANGTMLWHNTLVLPSESYSQFCEGFVANNNVVYVTGGMNPVGPAFSAVIIARFDSAGNKIWLKQKVFDTVAGSSTTGFSIDVDESKNVLVTGENTHPSYFGTPYTAKFADTAHGPVPDAIVAHHVAKSVLVYPQPANEKLNISLPAGAKAEWAIFDMAGIKQGYGSDIAVNGILTIVTAHLPQGAYVFHYEDETNHTSGSARFVVAH